MFKYTGFHVYNFLNQKEYPSTLRRSVIKWCFDKISFAKLNKK